MSSRLLLATAVILLLGVAAVVLAGSYIAQPFNHPVADPPAELHAEDVRIPSASGTILAGWLLRGDSAMGGILVLHGIRADRWSVLDRARFLHRQGYTVFLVDLQAHGESPGRHITFGHLESRDVEAAGTYLKQVVGGRRTAVIGPSLGGAAVLLASRPLPFDAVILESVYATVESATRSRLEERLGFLGGLLTPLLLVQLKPRLGISSRDLRPIDHMADLGAPLLLLSGEADRHPTPAEARAMYDRATEPKQMHLLPGAVHEDLFSADSVWYGEWVLPFLQRYLGGGPADSTATG